MTKSRKVVTKFQKVVTKSWKVVTKSRFCSDRSYHALRVRIKAKIIFPLPELMRTVLLTVVQMAISVAILENSRKYCIWV